MDRMPAGFCSGRWWLLRPRVASICLAVISMCACLWRCLHLTQDGHYYIISPDSYFFHWQAERILAGGAVPLTLHSGITYPLAWLAGVLSFVLGMTHAEALRCAGLVLPPLIGVITTVVLFVFVSGVWGLRAAIFSAMVWAVVLLPVVVSAAGYLDRDGLSLLLLLIGMVLFHSSPGWQLRTGGRRLGWLAGVAAALVVETLLYLEWMYVGPLVFLAAVGGAWLAEVALSAGRGLAGVMLKSEVSVLRTGIESLKVIASSVRDTNWRSLALLALLNVGAGAVLAREMGLAYGTFVSTARDALVGASSVAELQGLSLTDLWSFQFFTIPLVAGIALAVTKGRRADCLLVGWLGSMLVLSLLARRFLLYAAPSICVLCGTGLAFLLDGRGTRWSLAELAQAVTWGGRLLGRYVALGTGICVLVLGLLSSIVAARSVGSDGLTAANSDWEAGMEWVRDNTPPDAVVMSNWSFGYFILDMADRRPVVDNGYYGWDEERNTDVARAYCTESPSEAARVMSKYGAGYLVFSTVEYALLPTITEEAMGEAYGDGRSIPIELQRSVYARALSGRLVSEGGLTRVYPAEAESSSFSFVIMAPRLPAS